MRLLPLFLFLFPITFCLAQSGNQPVAADAQVQRGFCNIQHGKMYFEQAGTGNVLLLIHAGGLDCRMWDEQFNEFAKKYRVVRYDARNHGKTITEATEFSHPADLICLMDSLKIKKAVLCGLSMGGYVAIDFALEFPERVSALILVSPGLTGYNFTEPGVTKYQQMMREAQSTEAIAEYLTCPWFDGPSRTPEQTDAILRNRVKQMYLEFINHFTRGIVEKRSNPPAIGRLKEIKKPTLVITGALDQPGILEIAGMIEKQVKGAQSIQVQGVAHMINLEKPIEFNQIVNEFLDKLFKS